MCKTSIEKNDNYIVHIYTSVFHAENFNIELLAEMYS